MSTSNKTIYYRYLREQVIEALEKSNKSVLIYGPRQVGKTTLVKSLIRDANDAYFSCDDAAVAKAFTANTAPLRSLIGSYNRIIIDEAQRIVDAGVVIKILIDHFPDKQFIITGSSALELAYGMFDALTGRVFTYAMYPLSIGELARTERTAPLSLFDTYVRFGTYPEVVNASEDATRQKIISGIAKNYLFKDTLNFEMKKHSDFLEKLVALLASQTGSLVSLNSLSNALDAGRDTVDRYLYLLKQLFIIIPLHPYHNNFKKRLTKQSKYLFWDVGIRNAMIDNFGSLDVRTDKGGLWENFIIIERMKYNDARKHSCNYYFYRGENGSEIDLVEESGGSIQCFEIKYSADKVSTGVGNAAKELGIQKSDISVVNRENYLQFVM